MIENFERWLYEVSYGTRNRLEGLVRITVFITARFQAGFEGTKLLRSFELITSQFARSRPPRLIL